MRYINKRKQNKITRIIKRSKRIRQYALVADIIMNDKNKKHKRLKFLEPLYHDFLEPFYDDFSEKLIFIDNNHSYFFNL